MTAQQPYPTQPNMYVPQKKKPKWPWILGGIILVFILCIGGCMALIGGAVNEVDKESKRVVDVTYKVTGTSSDSASITYSDKNLNTAQDTQASLPWEKKVSIDGLGKFVSLSATNGSDVSASDSITCQVIVDGKVKIEQTAKGPFATASCSGDAGE